MRRGRARGLPTIGDAWRMPLVEDYRPALDSDVADVRHVYTFTGDLVQRMDVA